MRHITQQGLGLIQYYEGFSPRIYVCPAGYPTIGYGHVVRDCEKFPPILSRGEAESLLMRDVEIAEQAVLCSIWVPLADHQFDALVSFTFNLGSGALQRSVLRQKVNRGEHQSVPPEFRRWVWVLGKKSAGLIKRREAEALLYQGSS